MCIGWVGDGNRSDTQQGYHAAGTTLRGCIMQKWEYMKVDTSHGKVIWIDDNVVGESNPTGHSATGEEITSLLKRAGNDGWELVSVALDPPYTSHYFKRPKS